VIEPSANNVPSAEESDKNSTDFLRSMNLGAADEFNIVVTARARGTVPAALWNSSYFVFSTDALARQRH
jgi:hypothetical protein